MKDGGGLPAIAWFVAPLLVVWVAIFYVAGVFYALSLALHFIGWW